MIARLKFIRVVVACVSLCSAYGEVSSRNGRSITTTSTINGIVSPAACNGIAIAGGAVTYLVQQDFEGAGYDNGETWTEAGTGTINEDYTTSPLVGSQSLRLAYTSQSGTTTVALPADQASLDVYFRVNFAAVPASGKVFLRLRDAGGTTICRVEVATSNRITIRHGTGAATTTNGVSSATTYSFFLTFTKGSGANGIANIGYSTDDTRPTSGNTYVSVSNGTSTADVRDIMFGPENTSTWEAQVDKVRADNATIPSSPP
jgi:hypothetical protein